MTNGERTELQFGKELHVEQTPIPGLLVVDLPVHGDERGWFKENWQHTKMTELGLPDLGPVQNNISFNEERGVTRGIHAEPWDKYISVASGRIFGAWVDLREGESFGTVFTATVDPSKAVFVPRGVGNAFQALEDKTAYSYLVNNHWSEEAQQLYTFLNLADETADINWPIPLDEAVRSGKDLAHPRLADVTPMKPRATIVTGASGQLGRALRTEFPDAEFLDRKAFDIANPETWETRDWRQVGTVINAAAYTAVDAAETNEGRIEAWKANARGVQELSSLAIQNHFTIVHVSSDYVFDGTQEVHTEDEPFSPLGVYGQSKAAGDAIVSTVPQHYIARTTWVVGEGKNFVATMKSLAEQGKNPNVVADQIGRLTFTEDLAKAIRHLVDSDAPYGTYNVSNEGRPASWREIAQEVFELTGHDPARVGEQTTGDFIKAKQEADQPVSPRPLQSTLDLSKLEATGFTPRDWEDALKTYLDAN